MANKPSAQSRLIAFAATADAPPAPTYSEIPLHYRDDTEKVFSELKDRDWAFTDSDTRFLGHDLHPYPAKFIPQLPGTIISLLSDRGELVFDPFGGSGTTALEAIRLGRRAVSLDANPVAALIGRVKTARAGERSTAALHLLHAALRAFLTSLPSHPSELMIKYSGYAPPIANREKWFADSSYGELAHIKFRISAMVDETAKDIASLALSRTILAASFQDSETRYKSVPREVPIGEATRYYIKEFESVMKSVARNAAATRYGVSKFITGDARFLASEQVPESSVDLVVTSPPYGNAMDYHLYHRFRLLWLGHDPIAFGKSEIGSHLKHQREANGFDSYFEDLSKATESISRVLKNGRYAVLVIGDSVYEGKRYDTARLLAKKAGSLGFDAVDVFDREVHQVKRSFTPAGRRASMESLLVLRKRSIPMRVAFTPPPYKLWPYEQVLREREGALEKKDAVRSIDVSSLAKARRLVFTHQIRYSASYQEPTWQAILENGMASSPAARKDPKYTTHGIHPYKGKFYPQLAKALLNISQLPPGSRVLDPFCGSGTTLLEGYLNGFTSFGCDVNPLAAKIARAKTAVLDEDPDVFSEVVSGVMEALALVPRTFPQSLDQFNQDCSEEIGKWFAKPVAQKLNWLLATIRSGSDGASRDFLEVVLSSIIRDVSQQDPADLRIRYRKKLLTDADVIGLFREQLTLQFARVEKFWQVRSYAPNSFHKAAVFSGDNRSPTTYEKMGLAAGSVDLVITSPPYAMALPYIDTDRLSLLAIFGLGGSGRRPLEQALIGSREITGGRKKEIEDSFLAEESLPACCIDFVRSLHLSLSKSKDAGFRKKNMPALVHRFLTDMDSVFQRLHFLCRDGADAFVVIGDSKMTINGKDIRIPTTDFVEIIAAGRGFIPQERIDISVTTENLIHIKNAITENVVLRLRKSAL